MSRIALDDHIIGIAEILKVPEKEVMQVIFDAFENTPDANTEILEEVYWEFFQNDKKINSK